MTRLVLEHDIEEYLFKEVRKRAGICIKLPAGISEGLPDRLVLLPGGVAMFVELKRPKGGKVAPLQRYWQGRLTDLGFTATFAKTKEEIDTLLDAATK